MNDSNLEALVKLVVQRVRAEFTSNPNMFTKAQLATKSEWAVRDAIQNLMNEGAFPEGNIQYSEKSHQFPDIVINIADYSLGIEVKSSSSSNKSWSINGNSVLASTSVKVDATYLIFIKYNEIDGFDIRAARYEDCVANVEVTHSPRYRIDLNIDPSDSFFNKSGISYEQIKSSDSPIALITDYFRGQGKTAWWLGDYKDENSTSATILSWNDLNNSQIDEIYGQAFVLFPEIFSDSRSTKYKQLSQWLIAKYSVLISSLRDKFSAGGTVRLACGGLIIDPAPHIYSVLTSNKENVELAFTDLKLAELTTFWLGYHPAIDTIETRKRYWYSLLENHIADQQLKHYIKRLFKIDVP